MKLKQLLSSKQALENLLSNKLPVGIAWDLKLFVQKANPEFVSFEQIKNDKIKEYGETFTEDGKELIRVKPENIESFTSEINELLEKEVEINVPTINKDTLANFKDKDGKEVTVSVEDLIMLDWLIKD